jgi:hypothetical protein
MGATKARGRAALVVAACAIGLWPLAAAAQSDGDSLKWRASVYGWFPSIDGQTNFPTGASSPSINVDPSTYLDSLQMVFMGTIDVRSRTWGGFTDVIYLNFGADKPASRDFSLGPQGGVPAGLELNADYDLEGWAWTVAGTYALSQSPTYESNLMFGARMLNLKQTLNWTVNGNVGQFGLPGATGRSEVDATNWDVIVGAKGNLAVSADRRWSVPYYFDIGAGESKLTWQALLGVSYSFDWGSVVAAWRYMDYEFKDDAQLDHMRFNGPGIGVTFRW